VAELIDDRGLQEKELTAANLEQTDNRIDAEVITTELISISVGYLFSSELVQINQSKAIRNLRKHRQHMTQNDTPDTTHY